VKTIVISLFANTVIYRFAVEGGVLDHIRKEAKKRGDIRLVYLSSPVYDDALKPFLREGIDRIEYIQKYKPRTLLQKLFYFFYSYLIFTGTTRILATFGARADAPPAGGNLYLAPLKRAIAATFGRSRFVKTRIVPSLYRRIFGARPYRELLSRLEPSLVFLSNMVTFPDVELAEEARRQGIRTLGMTANWDHLNKYFIPIQTDQFLVQNEPMREEAIELQAYEPGRVAVVGFPQFDLYAHLEDHLMPRAAFCAHFGIPESSKIILFVSGSAYALDEPDILKTIADWIREGAFGDARLMIRPYVNLREREMEEKKYAGLKDDPMIVFNWMKHDERDEHKQFYRSMLAYADLVLSVFSTMAIEAAILDKPTLTIGFDGYQTRPAHQSVLRLEKLTHFRHVLDTGSVPIIRSFPELREHLTHYIAHPEDGRDKRAALVEHLCYKMDGNASKRIAEAVFAHA
jgi:hypothetical protein